MGIGAGLGLPGGVLVLAWARWFRPNQSQAVTGTLMFVVAAVVGADLLRDDTGLITGLVIGAILVNRPPGGVEPKGLAIQFAKLTRAWRAGIATLSTFLIGILFIILSARVTPHQIGQIGWVSLAFIAVLVLFGRPLAVALSTLGSKLPIRERAFIAWMAPRGIVAAATSSTFALGISQAGVGGGAEKLIPITFIVIVDTALIYGLSGGPVARALGVASTGPGGVLLVGATPVGRAIGRALQDRGLTVLVWTGNDEHARAAEADGLAVYRRNPIEDAAGDAPSDLDQLDYALLVGDDDALNAMVATDLSEYFGRDRVFQLPAKDKRRGLLHQGAGALRRLSDHDELLARIKAGAEVTVTEAPPAGKDGKDNGAGRAVALPMFVHTPGKDLRSPCCRGPARAQARPAADQPDQPEGEPPVTIAATLPLAVVMVAGPQIISAFFFATSEKWKSDSAAYVLGAAVSITAVVTVAYLVGQGDRRRRLRERLEVPRGRLVIVALLLLVMAYVFHGRKQTDPPKWMGKLQTATPRFTFTLGFLLLGFFPSDVVTSITVGAHLANHGDPWWHALPFVFLTLLLLALPALSS